MTVNVRRYIEGQLIGQLPPVTLPPTPWRAATPVLPVLEVRAEAPKKRVYRRKPAARSKYGFETLAVGEHLVVPFNGERRKVALRVSVLLAQRKAYWPERYSTKMLDEGLRVTRTA